MNHSIDNPPGGGTAKAISADVQGAISQEIRSTPGDADRRRTKALAALVGGLVSVMAVLVFATSPVPAEDAAILFRYAENVANGDGIVYNPGEAPVDGATDLGFMLLLAALHAMGIPIQLAAALTNAAALGWMAAVVFWSWRRLALLRPWWSLLPVGMLLVGPVWVYGSQGFGTITFAASCSTVALASELVARRSAFRALVVLGCLVVLAGLIRPEGFILGLLLVAAQAWRVRSARLFVTPASVVLTSAVIFMGLRWSYFGYPLPNPFYKKSGGELHPVGLRSTAAVLIRAGLPLSLLLIVGMTIKGTRRRALSLAFVLLGWAGAWLLISDEMNTAGRFQYSLVPVLLILCAPLYREATQSASPIVAAKQLVGLNIAMGIGIVIAAFSYLLPTIRSLAPQVVSPANARSSSIHAQVSDALKRHAMDGKRILATTEAGYVAWNSGWLVRDLWGLNDKEIAHGGYLDEARLHQIQPDVIFANVPTNNLSRNSREYSRLALPGWDSMTDPVLCFARSHDYQLMALWGSKGSLVVLANPNLPDLESLAESLQQIEVTGVPNTASAGELPVPRNCDRRSFATTQSGH